MITEHPVWLELISEATLNLRHRNTEEWKKEQKLPEEIKRELYNSHKWTELSNATLL